MEKLRNTRKGIAEETLQIIKDTHYTIDDKDISIKQALDHCLANTVLIRPEDDLKMDAKQTTVTKFTLKNQTSLEGCQDLIHQEKPVFCLNFASAKNPGGGFLGGAQAQEESLARSSGLYASLITQQEMYQENKKNKSCLYLDYMIYSPETPVFRDDSGKLLPNPYNAAFLTAPAVNAGVVNRSEPQNRARIYPTMERRVDRVLSLAAIKGHQHLVLGAWGCGVFQNTPNDIARIFKETLIGKFSNVFETVHLSVLDTKNRGVFEAFEREFNELI